MDDYDDFARIVAAYQTQMRRLDRIMTEDGRLYAEHSTDPGYAILLTRSPEPDASKWRVTSFRDGKPIGHRDYNHLMGESPINSAFQEFAGAAWDVFRVPASRPNPTPRFGDAGLGAPMGRVSSEPSDQPMILQLRRLSVDQAGYDEGGAYWGLGKPLYWAGDDFGETHVYLRAVNQAAALATLRQQFPNAVVRTPA